MIKIVLASASPRRRQILGEIVSEFSVIPSTREEKADLSLPPEEIVKSLARAKAEEVFSSAPDALVIGADTIVYFEGEVLGKPRSAADAAQTLKRLSGKEHSVFTGVCLKRRGRTVTDAVESRVLFHELTDAFIASYVASGSPMDKAGSYGIQDGGVVKDFTGSYTNIVGLPKEKIEELLRIIV